MHIIDWGSLDEEQINDDSLKRCLEHVGRLQRHSHLVLKSHKRLFTESRDSLQTGETESESFISYDSRIGIHREDLAISNIC